MRKHIILLVLLLFCSIAEAQIVNPGSGGATPSGSNGDAQTKNGSALGTAGLNIASFISTLTNPSPVTGGSPQVGYVLSAPQTGSADFGSLIELQANTAGCSFDNKISRTGYNPSRAAGKYQYVDVRESVFCTSGNPNEGQAEFYSEYFQPNHAYSIRPTITIISDILKNTGQSHVIRHDFVGDEVHFDSQFDGDLVTYRMNATQSIWDFQSKNTAIAQVNWRNVAGNNLMSIDSNGFAGAASGITFPRFASNSDLDGPAVWAAGVAWESGNRLCINQGAGSGDCTLHGDLLARNLALTGISPSLPLALDGSGNVINGPLGWVRTTQWTPATISGLQLWLDASQIGGLSNGATVTTWNDASGQGHNGSSQGSPKYIASGTNSKPTVRFNGSNFFTFGDLSASFPTGATVIIVAGSSGTNNDYDLYESRSGNDGHWRYTDNNSYMSAFKSAREDSLVWSMPNTGFHVYSLRSSSSIYKFNLDGGADKTGTAAYAAGTSHVLGINSGGVGFPGDISEVIIYDSTLSDANRQIVEAYLASKYNISGAFNPPPLDSYLLTATANTVGDLNVGSSGAWKDVHAANFIMESSALRTDTTNAHTGLIQAYDVNDATYRTFMTLTNGNTPSLTIATPSGGALTIDAQSYKVGGVTGVTGGVLNVLSVVNGLITCVGMGCS